MRKAAGESSFPGATFVNASMFDLPAVPMIMFEQGPETQKKGLEALREWEGVPRKVQLAAWALCEGMLDKNHPDRHFGLVADADILRAYVDCQEKVRDTHMKASGAPEEDGGGGGRSPYHAGSSTHWSGRRDARW